MQNPGVVSVFRIAAALQMSTAELMAEALASLGLQRGFVVHGAGGLDEISTTGESLVLEIQRGAIAHHTLTPQDFGVKTAKIADLRGGERDANLSIARAILSGEPGPKRDIVLVNASAALVAAGKATGFLHGVELAAESIDSGRAREKVKHLARFSQIV